MRNALNSDDPSIYGKAYKITGTPVVSGNYVNLKEGNSLYLSDAGFTHFPISSLMSILLFDKSINFKNLSARVIFKTSVRLI